MKPLTFHRTVVIMLLLLSPLWAQSQVKDIVSASKKSGGGRGDGGGRGGSDVSFAIDVFYFSFQGLSQWQRHTLAKRDSIPSLVSFDASFQAAMQPSSYYVLNPRIRGNWGLFSTDLRLNYLIEEAVEGPIHLRTTDWQIVQLNVVTTPHVNFRIGGGIMYEAYGYYDAHPEFTLAFNLLPGMKRIGAGIEYRDAEVRREVNGAVHYDLGNSGRVHWYATLGGAFQRYYSSINVWGIQGGLGFKFY